MRVAVVFFGLARALPLTIESIRRRIYAANRGDGISFCTFAALNLVARVHNPRAGELDVALDPADVQLLQADVTALVTQEDVAIAVPLAAAQRQCDAYQNQWSAVRNLLQQLLSLQRAWALCTDPQRGAFDFFLFLRPDLRYLDTFRLARLAAAFKGEGNIALPGWERHGGFNDRFAFADALAASHYAQRLRLVGEFCAHEPLHAERFLTFALDRGACSVCALPVRAQRVRAHGAIVQESFRGVTRNLPRTPQRFSLDAGGRPLFAKRFFFF
jgi:hypothetical protein